MQTPRPLIVSALFSSLLCGCNSEKNELTFKDYFPADNAIGSWVARGNTGLEIATDPGQPLFDLINGDAPAVLNISPTIEAFGRKPYTDGTYNLELRIWEFADQATSKAVYDGFIQDNLYSGNEYQDLSIGDAARVGDTGLDWIFNVQKGVYFVDVEYVRSPNAQKTENAALTAAKPFVEGVVAKLPAGP